MNGRSLLAFICILFVIGIFWMTVTIPKGETAKTDVKLFEPVSPIQKDVVVAFGPTELSEKKETRPTKEETPTPSEEKEPAEEKPTTKTPEVVSDEPPESVEYTPAYGTVAFTHLKHVENYEIDCGECHHEDMEGGMSKCINCHEPLKNTLHKNCQGCHKKLKKEGKETGPIKCRECHTKKAS